MASAATATLGRDGPSNRILTRTVPVMADGKLTRPVTSRTAPAVTSNFALSTYDEPEYRTFTPSTGVTVPALQPLAEFANVGLPTTLFAGPLLQRSN